MKSSKKKHLCMQIFHLNKDSRSKYQSIYDFHFIFPPVKTNFLNGATKFHFGSIVNTLLVSKKIKL